MKVNIPNILTLCRIVMIFVFLILAANGGEADNPETRSEWVIRMVASILAILAGVTDWFDGYLARKWNQVTDFGALMDPLADKIFVTAAMIVFVQFNLLPARVAVVVISREFLVTGLRMLAISKGKIISADKMGKLKTALQMSMLLLAGASWLGFFDLKTDTVYGCRLWMVWVVFYWAIVLITVLSGMSYFYRNRELLKSAKLS